MSKPREFWIEFGGDPSDDKEVYKRYSATVPFKGTDFSDEVIHVIEKSAYDKLEKENEELRAKLQQSQNSGERWFKKCLDLRCKLLIAVKAFQLQLEHICDGGGERPCSQMWFQDVAQETLAKIRGEE